MVETGVSGEKHRLTQGTVKASPASFITFADKFTENVANSSQLQRVEDIGVPGQKTPPNPSHVQLSHMPGWDLNPGSSETMGVKGEGPREGLLTL